MIENYRCQAEFWRRNFFLEYALGHSSTHTHNLFNIQAVDKHLIIIGMVVCAAVKEVNNKYVSYVEYYKSEGEKIK